jgi:uncharacterized protein YegP (UPF0339 family)
MTTTTKVEVYKDAQGRFRWRLRDPSNGLIVASASEAYERRIDAEKNIMRIKWLLGLEPEFVDPEE